MVRRNRHPEQEILELVNGSLPADSRETVQSHLTECKKCAAVAAVVGALRTQARAGRTPGTDSMGQDATDPGKLVLYTPRVAPETPAKGGSGQATPPLSGHRDLEFKDLLQDANVSRPILEPGVETPQWFSGSPETDSSAHLDTALLASFFQGELAGSGAAAVAGHLAMCSECAGAMSMYCDADAAARAGDQSGLDSSEMPEESWRLIKEWEENCLAEIRPENEAPSREMLERFLEILRDHREEIDRVAEPPGVGIKLDSGQPQIVPVVVLDSAGSFHGVEAFHRVSRPRGLEALQCLSRPDRFHNLPMHALVGAERRNPMVISGRINRGFVELDYGRVKTNLIQPLGYFIVKNEAGEPI